MFSFFMAFVPSYNSLGVFNITLFDKVCQWLAADQWFSPGALVSSSNKTDHHWYIVESGVKHHKSNYNPNPFSL